MRDKSLVEVLRYKRCSSSPVQAAQPATAAPWAVSVAELVVDDTAITFDDKVPAKPVSFALSGVGVQVGSFLELDNVGFPDQTYKPTDRDFESILEDILGKTKPLNK